MKLFEQEVPEILEGIVRINAVAREAGGRSKIAVSSNELRVDPVGACVGMKGSRVQGIVRELSGERIDIVPHSDDPIAFVSKALSPAKILQVVPDEPNRRMRIVVADDQLSLAIGKSGQNARLAARLTGYEIDLISEEEFAISRGQTPRKDHIGVEDIDGVGPKTVENLIQAGFESVQDIVKATIEDLINVPGVGDVTAQKIYLAAVQHLEKVEAERIAAKKNAEAESIAAAAAVAAAMEAPKTTPEAAPVAPEPIASVSEAEPVAAVPPPAPKPAAKPAPEKPVVPRKPDSYLDDIEAMESELTSGWTESGGEEPAEEPGEKPDAP
jgi:N utilization substance protein A